MSLHPLRQNADWPLAWAQAWMNSRASFYVTRALIGACEGGFIPGTILFATYFYKSRELAKRLACFWSTLNVCFCIRSPLNLVGTDLGRSQGSSLHCWRQESSRCVA